MLGSLLVIATLAADAPEIPTLPAFVAPASPEGSCPEPVALVPGEPVPSMLVDENGFVRCRAIALGYDHALELQALHEAYVPLLRARWSTDVRQLQQRYELDTGQLERERDWYRDQLEAYQNPPFFERPGTQRALGRVETTAVFIAAGLLVVGTAKLIEAN